MKQMPAVATAACAFLLLFSSSAAAQGESKQQPASTVVTAERGKFRILADGQHVGTEEFSIAPNGPEWLSKGSIEIKVPGAASTQVSGELRLAADGRPLGYTWSSQGAKKNTGTVTFDGANAEMELRSDGGPPFTQVFQFDSPQVVILDNNLYHQYGLLARLFDWNAKGVQTFSVLIPQDMATGKVTVEWNGPRDLDGKKAELLRVRSSDLEIDLYVSSGKLIQIEVAASKAVIRRE